VHHAPNLPLPSIDTATLRAHADIVCSTGSPASLGAGPGPARRLQRSKPVGPVGVTDLLRHLPEAVLQAALAELAFVTSGGVASGGGGGGDAHPACRIAGAGGTVEDVAALTGIALPALFEARTRGTCSVLQHALRNAARLPPKDAARVRALSRLTLSAPGALAVPDVLYIANAYNTLVTGYQCKLQQVDTYDWLDEERADAAAAVLAAHLPAAHALRFEVTLPAADVAGRSLRGVADVIDDTSRTLWELKCVAGALGTEHVLQLAAYAYLNDAPRFDLDLGLSAEASRPWTYKLLNVLTGEVIVLAYDRTAARTALTILMDAKNGGAPEPDPTASPEQRAVEAARFVAALADDGQGAEPSQPTQPKGRVVSPFMPCEDDDTS
jgi:hypothetical protein